MAIETRKRILYLKQITYTELCKAWGYKEYSSESMFVLMLFTHNVAFARCNRKGEVNWDKTLVYKSSEIKNRLIVIL